MKAIRIVTKKADENYDLGASKFFGAPTVPLAWEEDFDEDEIFLCQIRLSELADFDGENRLPHEGYLYIFLHTEQGERHLHAHLRYCAEEPALAIDDFNGAVEGYEAYTEAYLMEFSEAEEDENCTRLFGVPSDWSYEEAPPKLLMQFDPLDNEMGFLDGLDGYLYFVFDGEDERLDKVCLLEEYS